MRADDAPPDTPVSRDVAARADGDKSDYDFPWHGSIDDLHGALRNAWNDVLSHLGLEAVSAVEHTARQWHPMDGSTPPDCPYVDTLTREAIAADVCVRLEREVAFWNHQDPARSSVTLSVIRSGQTVLVVSGWSPASGSPHEVSGTRFKGELPPPLARALGIGASNDRPPVG